MRVSPTDLAHSVAELVRIPSVNPQQFGPKAAEWGEAGEAALAEHVAARFDTLGASEVVLDEAAPGRPNVYGWFPGRTDRLVVIDVHTDTVGVEHMTDVPFDGRIDDDHVWGRGALDTKATLGVVLALLTAWSRHGVRPEPNLLVLGSACEEVGGLLGAVRFRQWARARSLDIDQLLVAEPTRLTPVHGHKGGVAVRITTIGRAAHSALPHLGVNAIEAMVPVIRTLQDEHARLLAVAPTTELGSATLSVTMISGGTGANVIPDRCSIVAGRRAVPGEDPDEVYAQLEAMVRAASPVPVELQPLQPPTPDGRVGFAAFYRPAASGLVQHLARLAGTAPTVAPFGSNAMCYGDLAREMVVFGPGSIDDAHQATERIAIADLVRTAEVLEGWLAPA